MNRKGRPPEPGLDPYPAAVLGTIRRRRMLDPGQAVLVALSSGPDSTALVAALAALRDVGEVGAVFALFVDHGLRAGVESEAEAARSTCERLGVRSAP
jgi:tRNA(Ile)-lysidine synthase